MIRAVFKEHNGSIIFQLTGHAGTAEKGKDLVCASASILAYTIAQMALFMYTEGKLKKKPTVSLKEGNAVVTVKPKEGNDYAEALHSYFVVQVGLSLLANNYPHAVEVKMFSAG